MPRRPFIPDYIEKFMDIAIRKGDVELARIVHRHTNSIRFKQKCKTIIGYKKEKAKKVLKNNAKK